MQDAEVARRMGLTPSSAVPFPNDSPWLDEEKGLLKMMFDFATALASNIMWAHVCYSSKFPHVIALLLKRDLADRQRAMVFLRRMVSGIQAVEREHLTGRNAAVTGLYHDLAFQKMPLTREIIVSLLQTGFKETRELRELASMLYASSSTTKDCIDGFLSTVGLAPV